jgi:hypothetical protein
MKHALQVQREEQPAIVLVPKVFGIAPLVAVSLLHYSECPVDKPPLSFDSCVFETIEGLRHEK